MTNIVNFQAKYASVAGIMQIFSRFWGPWCCIYIKHQQFNINNILTVYYTLLLTRYCPSKDKLRYYLGNIGL